MLGIFVLFAFKAKHLFLPRECLHIPINWCSMNHWAFLQHRPWISPWIKSISNELDIIFTRRITIVGNHMRMYHTSTRIDWALCSSIVVHLNGVIFVSIIHVLFCFCHGVCNIMFWFLELFWNPSAFTANICTYEIAVLLLLNYLILKWTRCPCKKGLYQELEW